MKRIFFVFAVILLASFSTQAQLRIGAKAGLNFSKVSTTGGSFSEDNITGFEIGPSIEWLFIKNLGIEASAIYSERGIKVSNGHTIADEKTSYMDIPVNLKLMVGTNDANIKPYIAAGPYISFKLSGDDAGTDISNQWESESFAAGVNIGGGVELFKFLQVGVNYGIGLTDDYSSLNANEDYTAKSRTWSITTAVYF